MGGGVVKNNDNLLSEEVLVVDWGCLDLCVDLINELGIHIHSNTTALQAVVNQPRFRGHSALHLEARTLGRWQNNRGPLTFLGASMATRERERERRLDAGSLASLGGARLGWITRGKIEK
ncbi:hypothetical protein DVH05_028591 [Phytophthora capsici]|nr:hypothetical protein DVH05_028591 [Phytophthora capsici]